MLDIAFTILDHPITKWVFVVLALVMPLASLLTWAERRQSAMMQDRLGPNRANIGPIRLFGILHFVADALKMIAKEDFVPKNAHRYLFDLAPILALAPVFVALAIIPFGPDIHFDHLTQIAYHDFVPNASDRIIELQMLRIDFGLLFYFAILTLANYGATIAGWASYNKWALLGGLRASSQMMSYEVSMGLSLMGVFLFMGTLEPHAMVELQGGDKAIWYSNPLSWGIFGGGYLLRGAAGWPMLLVGVSAFLLFFTAAIAETKRAPFDLPEGEPEIIGYFVEYSGMRWGMFFLAEFVEIVFISMVIATVFLGGYQFPFLYADGFHFAGQVAPMPHWAVVLIQFAAFGAKVIGLCFLQLAIRWTLPRFRPDQLMKLGWQRLLPASLITVMAAAFFALFARGS